MIVVTKDMMGSAITKTAIATKNFNLSPINRSDVNPYKQLKSFSIKLNDFCLLDFKDDTSQFHKITSKLTPNFSK